MQTPLVIVGKTSPLGSSPRQGFECNRLDYNSFTRATNVGFTSESPAIIHCMHAQGNENAFDWIRLGRHELADSKNEGWAGNFVSHLMPPVFESYAKVLHRIEACYEDIYEPLTATEMSILKIPPCEGLRLLVESRRGGPHGSRIRWRDLSELLHVPYASEICLRWYDGKLEDGCWRRFLSGPAEGNLCDEERADLVSVLKRFTESGECYFRFAEMPFIGTDKPLLFQSALDELGAPLKAGAYQFSPEYWWPLDQSWCVCSDYDLTFTVVGGPMKLLSSLLRADTLECLEVTPQTRIDYFAPMP